MVGQNWLLLVVPCPPSACDGTHTHEHTQEYPCSNLSGRGAQTSRSQSPLASQFIRWLISRFSERSCSKSNTWCGRGHLLSTCPFLASTHSCTQTHVPSHISAHTHTPSYPIVRRARLPVVLNSACFLPCSSSSTHTAWPLFPSVQSQLYHSSDFSGIISWVLILT